MLSSCSCIRMNLTHVRDRWKAKFEEAVSDVTMGKKALAERDAAIIALAARLTPIEVDLAILVADRGR